MNLSRISQLPFFPYHRFGLAGFITIFVFFTSGFTGMGITSPFGSVTTFSAFEPVQKTTSVTLAH